MSKGRKLKRKGRVAVCRVRAPAKINLFLEVLGRRPDGYHDISTLFQEISLSDELVVRVNPSLPAGKVRLKVLGARLPAGPDNLICKAAAFFHSSLIFHPSSLNYGYDVILKKRIPIGAGLGGGSSDAAAMLKACWRLRTGRPLGEFPARAFLKPARRLGADVPFFLRGGLAEGRGIGDRLKRLPARGTRWFVLVFPKVFVSTKEVYKSLVFPLTNRRSSRKLKRLLSKGCAPGKWAAFLFNRLEETVCSLFPPVHRARGSLLRAGCLNALMSGSGSSVFGIAENGAHARRVASRVRSEGWQVWQVRSA